MQSLQKFNKPELGEIPKEWKIKEIKDVANIKGGKRLPLGEKFSKTKTPFPYIRVTDFKNGSIDKSNLQFLEENTHKKIKNYTISDNDVYISIAGTIGLIGLIPKELDGANLTENAAKITNLKDIRKDYLMYLFNSTLIQKQIQSHTGKVSQPKLALFRIEKINIPLPPLNEQQKIASILSNVDELIQKTEQIIEKIQRLKKGLMHILLTKGIGHSKFKDINSVFNTIEKVPVEWEFQQLEDLTYGNKSDIKMGPFGSSLKKQELLNDGQILVLWIENIVNNEMSLEYKRFISKEKYEKLKSFTVKEGDVLITMMGTLGRIAIVPRDIGTAIISSHLLKITLDKTRCTPKFLYYYLISDNIKKQITRESRGIVMEGLNTQIIKSMKIKLPQLQEQDKIVNILSNFDMQFKKMIEYKLKLKNLKTGLMQQLLTGKIRSLRI